MATFYLELHNKSIPQNTLIESRQENFSLDISVDEFIQILKTRIFNSRIGPGETISVQNTFKLLHEGINSKLKDVLTHQPNGRYEITATLVPQQKPDGIKVEIMRQLHNKKFQTAFKFANTIEAELDKLRKFNQLESDEVLYYGDELLDQKKKISDFSFFVNASPLISLTARKSQQNLQQLSKSPMQFYNPIQQNPTYPNPIQINPIQPNPIQPTHYSPQTSNSPLNQNQQPKQSHIPLISSNSSSNLYAAAASLPVMAFPQPNVMTAARIGMPIQLKPAAPIRVRIDDVPYEVLVSQDQTIYWLENQLNKQLNSRKRIYINGVLGTPDFKLSMLINSEFSLDTYQQSPDYIKVICKDKMSSKPQFDFQISSSWTVQELEIQILLKLSQAPLVDNSQHINLYLMGELLMISTNKLSQYPLYDQMTIYYQLNKNLQCTVAPFRKIIQYQNLAREVKLQIDLPVSSFKQNIISEIFGNQPIEICIQFQDRVLQDHLTFIQEGIKSQQMVDNIQISFGTLIFIIEEQTGQQISETIQKSQTIYQVKEKLSQQFDYDFELILNQQVLSNDITIGQLGVAISNPLHLYLRPTSVFFVKLQQEVIRFPIYKKHSLQFIHDCIVNQFMIQEKLYFTNGIASFDMNTIPQLYIQPNDEIYMFHVDYIKIVYKLRNGQTIDDWIDVNTSILIVQQFEPGCTIRVGQRLIKNETSFKEAGIKFGDVLELLFENEIQIVIQVIDKNQSSNNQMLSIFVNQNEKLNGVYQQLKTHFQAQQNLKLTKNNVELDLNQSFEQNGIQHNDQIQLIIDAPRYITLIIVYGNQQILNQQFDDSKLLMEILQLFSVSPENHFFTKNGQELDLSKTLRDNQLEKGDQIVLNQGIQQIQLHIQLPNNSSQDIQIPDNIRLLEVLQFFVKTDVSLFQIRKNNQPLDLNKTMRENNIVNDDSIQIWQGQANIELTIQLPNLSQSSFAISPSTVLEQVVAQLVQNDSPNNYYCTKNGLILDSEKTLGDLRLQNGDSLVLAIKPKIEKQITLVITLPNMEKVSHSFSVLLLLEQVVAALVQNDSPSNYNCTKNGLLLDSSQTLKDLGLIKGDEIVLAQKPKIEKKITLIITLPNKVLVNEQFSESLLLEQVVAAIIRNDSPSKYICIKNGQELDLKKTLRGNNLVKGDQIQLQIQKGEIDIEINFQNQQGIKLKMDSNERLQKLLVVLGQKNLIESSNIQFYKDGQLLEIMSSFSENKVNSGDIIQCVQLQEEILKLKCSSPEFNEQHQFQVANTTSIHELLLTITENYQLAENDFRIYKDGRILDNNANCAQCGLKDQDHLQIIRINQKQNQNQQQQQAQNIKPSLPQNDEILLIIKDEGSNEEFKLQVPRNSTLANVISSIIQTKPSISSNCVLTKNNQSLDMNKRISDLGFQPQEYLILKSDKSEPLFIKVIGQTLGYLKQSLFEIAESTTVEDVLSVMQPPNQSSKLYYNNQIQTDPQSRISRIITDNYHVFTLQV